MDTSEPSELASRGSRAQATVEPDADSGEFVWYHDLVWMRARPGGSAGETPKQSLNAGQGRGVVCVKLSNGQQVKFSIQSGEQLKQMIDSLERAI